MRMPTSSSCTRISTICASPARATSRTRCGRSTSTTSRSMARTIVEAPDGRRLEVFVEGPEGGTLVIHQHGTPSCGMLYGPRVAAAVARGLRIAGFSRPGYGSSDRNEGRTVADVAADVEAIADALGADCFYTTGGSGGAPHALAT